MEFRYGMRSRGFAPMCQPMTGLIRREDDPTDKYFDVLVYGRELSQKELADYQLDRLAEKTIYRFKGSVNNVKEDAYKILFMVKMTPEQLMTAKTIKAALDEYTDYYQDMTLEEFEEEYINTVWLEVYEDGVVAWYDGV